MVEIQSTVVLITHQLPSSCQHPYCQQPGRNSVNSELKKKKKKKEEEEEEEEEEEKEEKCVKGDKPGQAGLLYWY